MLRVRRSAASLAYDPGVSASRDRSTDGDRFIAGDPLRGLAALGVFVLHAGGAALLATGYEERFPGVEGRLDAYGDVLGSLLLAGFFGVWIFFVLSGYLIGRPFVRAAVDGRPAPSMRRYARNRALRILPAYWAVLTVVIVFVVWLTGKAGISAGQLLPLYAFVLPDDNPLGGWIAHVWTLEVEAKFYIAMPLAAFVVAPAVRRLSTARLRALAIAVPCLAWVVLAPFLTQTVGVNAFLSLLRLFVAGIALAALEPLVRQRFAGRRGWATAATGIFAVAALYIMAFPALYTQVGAPFRTGSGALALDLSVSGLIAAALLRQWTGVSCWRLLDNSATRWLGSRSYSFYLVHLGLVMELSKLLAKAGHGYKVTFILVLIAAIAASALAAELLYRTVERPFLERKRRARLAAGHQPVAVPLG